jgi:beta-lactamase class A
VTRAPAAVAAAITDAFERAGVTGWLHALGIDTGDEVDVGADAAVAMASVFKVPVLVALYRAAEDGGLALTDRVRLGADERTLGMTGLGAMADDAELSLRDLALLMITISDNAAADAVFARVGHDTVSRVLTGLGLTDTAIRVSCQDLHDMLTDDLAGCGLSLAEAVADPGALARFRSLDPDATNGTTPRDMTALLAAIWRDEAAPAPACRAMRRILGLQVWPHRLASGFPTDDVRVAGKTGTLPTLRSEIGVIELPGGRRYAVAVFTRSWGTSLVDPAADAVIGTAARLAVDHLDRA